MAEVVPNRPSLGSIFPTLCIESTTCEDNIHPSKTNLISFSVVKIQIIEGALFIVDFEH